MAPEMKELSAEQIEQELRNAPGTRGRWAWFRNLVRDLEVGGPGVRLTFPNMKDARAAQVVTSTLRARNSRGFPRGSLRPGVRVKTTTAPTDDGQVYLYCIAVEAEND